MNHLASSILYFHGPSGSGRTAIASHMVSDIYDTYPDATVVSFSFRKDSLGNLTRMSFYVSMIRQLLLSQPTSYRRVSAICEWISRECSFSSERLRSLFLSLLKDFSLGPVICLIREAQEESTFSLTNMVDLVRSHRGNSKAIFKVLILGEEPQCDVLRQASDICCEINLADKTWHDAAVGPYIQSRLKGLVHQRPEWQPFGDAVVERLCASTMTFPQARLSMRLLETSKVPSTSRAVAEVIENLPGSMFETYGQALDICQSQCPIPLPYLLRWIHHSVRLLSVNELSVIVALDSRETLSIDDLKANTPLSIYRDLEGASGTLVTIDTMQIYPIHQTMGNILDRQDVVDDGPDCTILLGCLKYLDIVMEHIGTTASGLTDVSGFCPMEGVEFHLLGYAVLFWPEHYKRAKDKSRSKERLLHLLAKKENMEIWSRLYQKYAGVPTDEYSTLNTLLKIASRFGLADIAKEAIVQSRIRESFREDMSKALDLAAGYGHQDIVHLLLQGGAQSSEAMCLATDSGFMSTLEVLVRMRPDMINAKDKHGRSPFVVALLNGSEEIASYLLGKDADSDVGMGPGVTASHLAAKTGQVNTLRLLLGAGIDVKTIPISGDHPLGMASASGFDDIVILLIDNGADINAQDADGMTALHFAVKHGHFSTSALLIDNGASTQKESADGLSPIHLASQEGFLDIVKHLASKQKDFMDEITLDGGDDGPFPSRIISDDSANTLSPLQLAVYNGHDEIVCELLRYVQYNSKADRAIALRIAAEEGFSDIVKLLLNAGFDRVAQDRHGNTALHLAAQGGGEQYTDIVRQLLTSKSNSEELFDSNATNSDGWTALHHAANFGRLSTIRVLLQHGANMEITSNKKSTALHIAAKLGQLEVIKELLEYMICRQDTSMIFLVDDEEYTPFTLAVKEGHTEVVQVLLEASSEEPLKLQGDLNALWIAIENNQEGLIASLVEQGWELKTSNPVKISPLQLAVQSGSSSMVRLLVGLGANLDAKWKDGVTPLHVATDDGKLSIVETLLGEGANEDAKDNRGKTPLHYATCYSNDQPDLVKVLLEGGANVNEQDDEGVTPLWQAAWGHKTKTVKELLKWSPELEHRKAKTGWTALHASHDDVEITRELIGAGANPDALDESGHPPYFLAAGAWNSDGVIQCYVDNGTDIMIETADSMTALHIAASEGVLKNVELLLALGANVNSTNDDTEAPIHLATHQNRRDVVEYLLDHGADREMESFSKGTPLMAAASKPATDTTVLLLEKGVDVNATSEKSPFYTALQAAAVGGFEDITQILLNNGALANITDGTHESPLCAAVMARSLGTVKLLLDAHADIDYAEGPTGTALQLALAIRFGECVDLFLGRGADVNQLSNGRHGTALIAAIDRDDLESVNKLLERGADVELSHPDRGELPIQVAIRKGMLTVLEALLRFKPRTHNKDKLRRGTLSQCIAWKSDSLLPLLLENPDVEIDIDEQDYSKQTPLMLAVLSSSSSIFTRLMNSKPNLNQQDRWGKTALIYAVCRDYDFVVSSLLANGADPLIQDRRGRDALYWAAHESNRRNFDAIFQAIAVYDDESCQPSLLHALNAAVAIHDRRLVEVLFLKAVQHKGWYDYADEDGWTAMYTAERYQHDDIISLLNETAKNEGIVVEAQKNALKIPTEWHLDDMGVGLCPQPDARCIVVGGVLSLLSVLRHVV